MRGPTCLLLITALAAGCGPDEITLPTPPATVLPPVEAYDQPTGTVPVDQLAATATDMQARFDRLNESRMVDILVTLLSSLRRRLDDGGLPVDPAEPTEASVDASAQVHRTCRGWDDATTPDPDDGTLELTALIAHGQLERRLWTIADACHARVDIVGSRAAYGYIDGVLGITLLGQAPSRLEELRVIVHVDGTLGSDKQQTRATIDFRFVYPTLEVLRPVSDGVIVASVGSDGIQMRGRNGTFTCNLRMGTCGSQ